MGRDAKEKENTVKYFLFISAEESSMYRKDSTEWYLVFFFSSSSFVP